MEGKNRMKIFIHMHLSNGGTHRLLLILLSAQCILCGTIYFGPTLHFLRSKINDLAVTNNDNSPELHRVLQTWSHLNPARNASTNNLKIILRYKMHPRAKFKQSMINCGEDVCMVTTNTSLLKQATAVMFNPLHSPLPWYKNHQQYWVMSYREAPARYPAQRWHNGRFNLIMSYHKTAGDIYAPYFMTYQSDGTPKHIPDVTAPLIRNTPKRQVACPARQLQSGKNIVTKVLWYSSNCYEYYRLQYSKELKKHGIHVDLFGDCWFQKSDPCKKGRDEPDMNCLSEFAKKYKFYLSFENSICQDYITGMRYYFPFHWSRCWWGRKEIYNTSPSTYWQPSCLTPYFRPIVIGILTA